MVNYPIYEIKNFNNDIDGNKLYINNFRDHLINHSFIESSHRHNFYLLVLFTKGHGVHKIDFKTFDINRGSAFMIKPSQVHSWKLSDDIDGFIVFFTEEVYNLYFGKKRIQDYPFYANNQGVPMVNLFENELNAIENYFKLLINETRNFNSKKLDKLINLLDIIHIELSRKYLLENKYVTNSYGEKVEQFNDYLNTYFKTEKSPAFYASKLDISLKHLNRICNEKLNKTVTDLIAQKIVLESKRMLTFTEKSISEIAQDLGYLNFSYFTKLFKKHTGTTPSAFRSTLKLSDWE